MFQIWRSQSMKEYLYDNALAESIYKTIKIEYVKGRCFSSLEGLNFDLVDYANWFSNHRTYFALAYQTSAEYRKITLKNFLIKY